MPWLTGKRDIDRDELVQNRCVLQGNYSQPAIQDDGPQNKCASSSKRLFRGGLQAICTEPRCGRGGNVSRIFNKNARFLQILPKCIPAEPDKQVRLVFAWMEIAIVHSSHWQCYLLEDCDTESPLVIASSANPRAIHFHR